MLTYLVPGGEFERQSVVVMGRERLIVVPGSFHHVPAHPQGFLQLWTVFMRGAVEGAEHPRERSTVPPSNARWAARRSPSWTSA